MQNWLSRCNRVVFACVWCGVELDPPVAAGVVAAAVELPV